MTGLEGLEKRVEELERATAALADWAASPWLAAMLVEAGEGPTLRELDRLIQDRAEASEALAVALRGGWAFSRAEAEEAGTLGEIEAPPVPSDDELMQWLVWPETIPEREATR